MSSSHPTHRTGPDPTSGSVSADALDLDASLNQPEAQRLVHRLRRDVLEPLKRQFVGKDEIIDLLGLCLVARENLFLLGPPGTAKSALVQQLAARIDGRVFDYLLTRFTEPNEIFGPFDIAKLRDGLLETNTEGMLPEADLVFLDELLNANSAILNSLLLVLNERVFRRGRETRRLPTLLVVGASNHLPEDDALQALFDRFLVRVPCPNVPEERLGQVLQAGWGLEGGRRNGPESDTSSQEIDEISLSDRLDVDSVRRLHRLILSIDLAPLRTRYAEVILGLRRAGLALSDRRAVKLQRLVAASALLCGRTQANITDLWVLRYVWDSEPEQELLASLVTQVLDSADDRQRQLGHPRSQVNDAPDADKLDEDLDRLASELEADPSTLNGADRAQIQDQLALLTARCQWVPDAQRRAYLEDRTSLLWNRLAPAPSA